MVSMQFFGLRPVLNVPYNHMLPNNLYWHLIALGILLGILGRLYQVIILHLNGWMARIPKLSPIVYPIIPFLLVIPIAWYFPITLGGGNELIIILRSLPFSLALLWGFLSFALYFQ